MYAIIEGYIRCEVSFPSRIMPLIIKIGTKKAEHRVALRLCVALLFTPLHSERALHWRDTLALRC